MAGHRPPGVVIMDDDVIVGGTARRGRYRTLNFRNRLIVADDNDRADIDAQDDFYHLEYVIDGGGAAITTGVKGDLEVPQNGTITGWTALADQSGSIVVDVWKDTYANFPPTVADTIAGSEKPTISSALKGQDLALSTWTTAVTRGDIIRFNVDSITTCQRVTISIRVTKT
ncbi:MAG: hypothetical protein ACREKH_18195 [Candidatus Rokuibacteriota bacterium]